jgi:hypothetical protein
MTTQRRTPELLTSLSEEEFRSVQRPSPDDMRAAMARGRDARDAAVAANRRPVLVDARVRYRPAR